MYAAAELPMPAEWDFADIYREHHRRVYNLRSYLLNSRDAAEDAVHEVFLRVHRKIETYDPALPFSNWVLKVAGKSTFRERFKEMSLVLGRESRSRGMWEAISSGLGSLSRQTDRLAGVSGVLARPWLWVRAPGWSMTAHFLAQI